jgi:hypothetical protein
MRGARPRRGKFLRDSIATHAEAVHGDKGGEISAAMQWREPAGGLHDDRVRYRVLLQHGNKNVLGPESNG